MTWIVKRIGFYLTASILFMVVMLLGFTVFYRVVEGPHNPNMNSWLDAFYFTVITTRTIGFGDISPQTAAGKLGTILNALLPATVFLGTSLVVLEALARKFENHWRDWLMRKHCDHTVVVAETDLLGSIAQEYRAAGEDFVIIHPTPPADLPEGLAASFDDRCYLAGDPTIDAVLQRARIDRAKRLIVATADDGRNMFVVVSARSLNPDLVTIVRVNEAENEAKLTAIGATYVLPTYSVLGRMLCQAATKPVAHDFLVNLNTRTADPFLEQVTVGADTAGQPVRAAWPDAVALKRGDRYVYKLDGETLHDGDVVLRIQVKYGV